MFLFHRLRSPFADNFHGIICSGGLPHPDNEKIRSVGFSRKAQFSHIGHDKVIESIASLEPGHRKLFLMLAELHQGKFQTRMNC